jgi:Zn-dependent protease with chaperone function
MESTQRNPFGFLASLYEQSSERLGKSLFQELVKADTPRPTLTISKILAFLLATLVLVLVVAMFGWGVWLVSQSTANPFGCLMGVVLVLAAIAARPRVQRFPKRYATAEEYPALFEAIGKIAKVLNTSNVDALILNGEYNAGFAQPGWRRRRLMVIGVPLFAILEPQERIALIAHELAHGVNGDPVRGVFVGTALYSLATWYFILHVQRGTRSIPGTIANVFMWLLSYIPFGLFFALAYLSWRDSQRAEYLADALGAQVSGSRGAIGALWKTKYDEQYYKSLQYVQVNPGRSWLEEFRNSIVALPNAVMDTSQLDSGETYPLEGTHPPTPYRIEMLKARPALAPRVSFTEEEWARIEQELEPKILQIQPRKYGEYR